MIAFRDPLHLRRQPLVTIALIALNVIVYLLAIGNGGSLLGGPSNGTLVAYGAIPRELTHSSSHCALSTLGASVLCSGQPGVIGSAGPQPATWETIFSSLFLHADLLALAANMLFLGLAGAIVEGALGQLRFLALYLLGGLVALALCVAVAPDSTTPALGAGGAIAAVLGAALVLEPSRRIAILLGLWLVFDTLGGAIGVATRFGEVHWYAHIGGLALGLLAIRALARRAPRGARRVPS